MNPADASQQLLNIPKSRLYGGEVELTVRPSDTFTFHGGLGLLSTRIKEGIVSGVNVAGNRLSNAPTLTFNASFDWTMVQGKFGAISFHPEVAYQSSQFFENINIPRLRQTSYALFGGHLDWNSSDGRYSISAWARNLGNKFYFTSRIDLTGFGLDYNHIGNPRMYGVTAGVKF